MQSGEGVMFARLVVRALRWRCRTGQPMVAGRERRRLLGHQCGRPQRGRERTRVAALVLPGCWGGMVEGAAEAVPPPTHPAWRGEAIRGWDGELSHATPPGAWAPSGPKHPGGERQLSDLRVNSGGRLLCVGAPPLPHSLFPPPLLTHPLILPFRTQFFFLLVGGGLLITPRA